MTAPVPDHAMIRPEYAHSLLARCPATLKTKQWVFAGSINGGFGWWKVFIDSDGALSILSDFGNYGSHWSRGGIGHGRTVLEFFLRADDDYLLGKFCSRNWLDVPASVRALRKLLVETRRELGAAITRDEQEKADGIRALWDQLGSITTEHDWNDALMHADGIDSYDLWGCAAHDFEPQARAFFREVWPRVREQIRAEVERGEVG